MSEAPTGPSPTGPSPADRERAAPLLARLAALGIARTTVEHAPVFTVAESAPLKASIPGLGVKNLFLKDRRGAHFLVTARDDASIDLKRLHERLGAASRLSFASAEGLRAHLGVEPGSVTPFAAMNDASGAVTVALDAALAAAPRVNAHPLVNSMTTGVTGADLLAFLRATGHEPLLLDFPSKPADEGAAGASPAGAASEPPAA